MLRMALVTEQDGIPHLQTVIQSTEIEMILSVNEARAARSLGRKIVCARRFSIAYRAGPFPMDKARPYSIDL